MVGEIRGLRSNEGIEIILKNVLYVPDLRENLISVHKMTKTGIDVVFKKNDALIKKDGILLATGKLKGCLYELELFKSMREGCYGKRVADHLIRDKPNEYKMHNENIVETDDATSGKSEALVAVKQISLKQRERRRLEIGGPGHQVKVQALRNHHKRCGAVQSRWHTTKMAKHTRVDNFKIPVSTKVSRSGDMDARLRGGVEVVAIGCNLPFVTSPSDTHGNRFVTVKN